MPTSGCRDKYIAIKIRTTPRSAADGTKLVLISDAAPPKNRDAHSQWGVANQPEFKTSVMPTPEIESHNHIHELVRKAFLAAGHSPAFRAFIQQAFAPEGSAKAGGARRGAAAKFLRGGRKKGRSPGVV